MNIYCRRIRSCEDKPGYLQNAEGSRDAADGVFTMHSDFAMSPLFVEELCLTSQAVCPEPIEVSRRPALSPASCRHA